MGGVGLDRPRQGRDDTVQASRARRGPCQKGDARCIGHRHIDMYVCEPDVAGDPGAGLREMCGGQNSKRWHTRSASHRAGRTAPDSCISFARWG